MLGLNRCADPTVMRLPVGWFSPTYKMLLEVWRDAVRMLAPITSRRSVQERRIELTTGGVLEFWSLENDVARGRKYKRIIIDEAAMVPNLLEIWQFALRPTLADYTGDAYFLSTPKGRNGFWQMWQWGQDANMPEWVSWKMPSNVNPTLAPSEINELRRTLPERVYLQEIEAEFIDDAGGVFRRIRDCATATLQPKAQDNHQYAMSADWGKSNDFTVLTVVDLVTREVVALDRFNQIDYTVQVGRLKALYERFKPTTVIAERNSIGEPLIEQLQREGLPVTPFTTTNATKAAIVDALALAFERGDIRIPNDNTLIAELQSFEMERLPSGMLRYSAPEGSHDDMVISLALAWQAVVFQPATAANPFY